MKNSDTFTAEVVDVDAFTTTAAGSGYMRKVKGNAYYISAGTIEDDRPDINLLQRSDWPGISGWPRALC
ncbi:hypothetical protein CS542_07765 [Pedobacter sp. IW39]|nr:hypothetical protein CS542_07765 [Pedobacter sp. IW39]